MKTIHLSLFILLLTHLSFSFDFRGIEPDLRSLEEGILNENKKVEGFWQGSEKWDGTYFCDGKYSFKAQLQVWIDSIKFDVMEDEWMQVAARLNRIYAGVEGGYRSEKSLCVPLNGWVGMGVDSLDILARVDFVDGPEGNTTLKVKVNQTKFGTIHIGSYVPEWVEKALTRALNWAVKHVWESRLGNWLNDWISEQANNR